MINKEKTKNFSLIAEATKTAVAVLVAGKFETLGSNFSHETTGLLASVAIQEKFFIFCFTVQIRNE